MLTNDISDPRIWTEIFSTPSYQDFVHLARPLHSTVSPAISYAQASCMFKLGEETKESADILVTWWDDDNDSDSSTPIEYCHTFAGFAFVYFEDERDAEDAIHGLDDVPFGYERRRLSVEWAKGERGRYGAGSRLMPNQRPTRTLFVINFDPLRTMARDIERHFEPYGRILNVRIRRNFAFVQFETQDDATRALECTHMSKMLDRVVSVEYALRDDDERDYVRGSYGRRGSSPYGRSPSPGYRRRPSPDYGRARSPGYERYSGLAYRSPVYDRNRSSEYGRYRSRTPIRR